MESMSSLTRLLRLCSTVVGVDISSKSRQRDTYVYGRAVFYTVAKELHPLTTLHVLGSYTKRDHASVIFALRNAKDTYRHDPAYLNKSFLLRRPIIHTALLIQSLSCCSIKVSIYDQTFWSI